MYIAHNTVTEIYRVSRRIAVLHHNHNHSYSEANPIEFSGVYSQVVRLRLQYYGTLNEGWETSGPPDVVGLGLCIYYTFKAHS